MVVKSLTKVIERLVHCSWAFIETQPKGFFAASFHECGGWEVRL
jgi:hypothetical protein